jgi:hypothetical protein
MTMKDTITEFLKYDYTPDEIRELGRDLARKTTENAEVELQLAAVKSQFKDRQSRLTAEISTLSRQVANGYEHRNVECKIQWHTPRLGMKTIIRCDTGEVVRETQMSNEERQQMLPFESQSDSEWTEEALEQELRNRLKASTDDTVFYPEDADTDVCDRLLKKIQSEPVN